MLYLTSKKKPPQNTQDVYTYLFKYYLKWKEFLFFFSSKPTLTIKAELKHFHVDKWLSSMIILLKHKKGLEAKVNANIFRQIDR